MAVRCVAAELSPLAARSGASVTPLQQADAVVGDLRAADVERAKLTQFACPCRWSEKEAKAHVRNTPPVEAPGAQARIELPATLHQRQAHLGVDALLRNDEREGAAHAGAARGGLGRAFGGSSGGD